MPKFRWSLKKALGVKPQPGEMFPGVVRPSYALAGLVAGRMLQNPLGFKPRKQEAKYEKGRFPGTYFDVLLWSDDRMKVSKRDFYVDYDRGTTSWEVQFDGWIYDGFTTDDWQIIKDAFYKSFSLKSEMERNKQEAEKQQKACDIIESFFKTPPQADCLADNGTTSQSKEKRV